MTHPLHPSDLASGADRVTRSRSTLWRGAVAVAALTLVALAATACGSGSPKSSTTTTAPAGAAGSSGPLSGFLQQAVKYAQCMRAHGVTNYPDPPGNGAQPINPAGVDTNSATYRAAAQACQKYAPPGANDPNQQANARTQALKFARCMRAHGEPKFPDPPANNASGGKQSVTQFGIDPNTPTFQAANRACSSLLGP
jgi:hypothetical protein